MKYIYSLIFVLSVSINAQDYEPKYEVDANKAEYYVGTFNDNKDVDDLTAWYGKFAKWAESKDGTYDNMTVAILQPYSLELLLIFCPEFPLWQLRSCLLLKYFQHKTFQPLLLRV